MAPVMGERRVRRISKATARSECKHCSEPFPATVEWRCPHGDWCARCFYEHLQPVAKVKRLSAQMRLVPDPEPLEVPA